MIYTNHALQRISNRALPEEVLETIYSLGEEFSSNGRSRIIKLANKLAKSEFVEELRNRGIKLRKKWLDAYLVCDESGVVITAGYRNKRIFDKY